MAITFGLSSGVASATDTARFVPEASHADWDGSVATVSFREVGLEPYTRTRIYVQITGRVEAGCTLPGGGVLSITAASIVANLVTYWAAADGAIDGHRAVHLTVAIPTLIGFGCPLAVTRSLSVRLRDLHTGSVLVLGDAPASRRMSG